MLPEGIVSFMLCMRGSMWRISRVFPSCCYIIIALRSSLCFCAWQVWTGAVISSADLNSVQARGDKTYRERYVTFMISRKCSLCVFVFSRYHMGWENSDDLPRKPQEIHSWHQDDFQWAQKEKGEGGYYSLFEGRHLQIGRRHKRCCGQSHQ